MNDRTFDLFLFVITGIITRGAFSTKSMGSASCTSSPTFHRSTPKPPARAVCEHTAYATARCPRKPPPLLLQTDLLSSPNSSRNICHHSSFLPSILLPSSSDCVSYFCSELIFENLNSPLLMLSMRPEKCVWACVRENPYPPGALRRREKSFTEKNTPIFAPCALTCANFSSFARSVFLFHWSCLVFLFSFVPQFR